MGYLRGMRTIKDDLVDAIIQAFYENGFRSDRPVDMKSILDKLIEFDLDFRLQTLQKIKKQELDILKGKL